MNDLYCQSCGMPLKEKKDFGTNADGSQSEDYCVYCYQNGAFTQNCTMEEMIDLCLDMEEQSGGDFYGSKTREAARKAMLGWYPTMKRWK